jgi:hypothetical protein
MAKVRIPPNRPSTARALPLFAQVLPQALPGLGLHVLALHQQEEIKTAPLRVDLVGMLLAKSDKGRRADPWPA